MIKTSTKTKKRIAAGCIALAIIFSCAGLGSVPAYAWDESDYTTSGDYISLTLDGSIGANIYLNLAKHLKTDDVSGALVEISSPNQKVTDGTKEISTYTGDAIVSASAITEDVPAGISKEDLVGKFKFTCKVAAPQIFERVTVRVFKSEADYTTYTTQGATEQDKLNAAPVYDSWFTVYEIIQNYIYAYTHNGEEEITPQGRNKALVDLCYDLIAYGKAAYDYFALDSSYKFEEFSTNGIAAGDLAEEKLGSNGATGKTTEGGDPIPRSGNSIDLEAAEEIIIIQRGGNWDWPEGTTPYNKNIWTSEKRYFSVRGPEGDPYTGRVSLEGLSFTCLSDTTLRCKLAIDPTITDTVDNLKVEAIYYYVGSPAAAAGFENLVGEEQENKDLFKNPDVLAAWKPIDPESVLVKNLDCSIEKDSDGHFSVRISGISSIGLGERIVVTVSVTPEDSESALDVCKFSVCALDVYAAIKHTEDGYIGSHSDTVKAAELKLMERVLAYYTSAGEYFLRKWE